MRKLFRRIHSSRRLLQVAGSFVVHSLLECHSEVIHYVVPFIITVLRTQRASELPHAKTTTRMAPVTQSEGLNRVRISFGSSRFRVTRLRRFSFDRSKTCSPVEFYFALSFSPATVFARLLTSWHWCYNSNAPSERTETK